MFCKLKKLEPIIMFLAHNFLIILAVKRIYNFISNLAWVLWTLQLNVSVLLSYSTFQFFPVLFLWYSSEYICTCYCATQICIVRTCNGNLAGWEAVTCWYYIKTAKPISKLFPFSGSPIIPVISGPCADTKFQGNPFSGGYKYTRGGNNWRFSTEISVYLGNGEK